VVRLRRLLSVIGRNVSITSLKFRKGTLLYQYGIEIEAARIGAAMMRSCSAPTSQRPEAVMALPVEESPPR
jgi:hypothetical protein